MSYIEFMEEWRNRTRKETSVVHVVVEAIDVETQECGADLGMTSLLQEMNYSNVHI